MKRKTQVFLVMAAGLAAFAVQAGRGIDSAVPAHRGAAVEEAATGAGGVGYMGRPSDSVAVRPVRSEGEAEFAVMDVQKGDADRAVGAYHGRPMDDPTR